MFEKFKLIKQHWGLLIIFPLLIIITFSSIKPGFVVAGWDNFSTSLDSNVNFGRTLFASWRQYRSLGVPSDSEVVDIFRQIFFVIPSLLKVPELGNQVYITLALFAGVLGVHLLARNILKKREESKFLIEFGATIASIFYLFNMHTLATFYFPMPMFIARYAFLPLLIFFFIRLLESRPKKTIYLAFIITTLLGSVSYLTATNFLVTLLILSIISLSYLRNFTRSIKILGLFLAINSFWLLTFANYSLQKSNIIQTASTFIEVNEIQLNESPSHFRWSKLLTFYPNFFYTQAKTIGEGDPINLHPLVSDANNSQTIKAVFLIFPLLYLSGSVIIVISKKGKKSLWIPLTIAISLFALRKEYPPLGFVYDWLGRNINLFRVVFRFADTKFYSPLAIAGSLGAAIAIIWIVSVVRKNVIRNTLAFTILFFILLSNIISFKYFFEGSFISSLMYNKIPGAYYDLADEINNDPENFRVMHLPLEITSYWKPYDWGFVGSTFLGFLLDKPLVDRTYEPGSEENDNLDQALLSLALNTQNTESQEINDRADQLYRILQATRTKYIILDNTVSVDVHYRDTTYWGVFPSEGFTSLIQNLQDRNLVNLTKSYEVTKKTIDLYQVANYDSPESTDIVAADYSQPNSLIKPLLKPVLTIQSASLSGKIFPFFTNNLRFEKEGKDFSLNIPSRAQEVTFQNSSNNGKQAYDIFARVNENGFLTVGISHRPYPLKVIGGSPSQEIVIPVNISNDAAHNSLDNYLSDWHILPANAVGSYRLSIDNTIIPVPDGLSPQPEYLASILSENATLEIQLLQSDREIAIDLKDFNLTDEPNCFKDQYENYSNVLDTNNKLSLTSTNGTTCLTHPLNINASSDHVEAEVSFDLTSTDEISTKIQDTPSGFQKAIKKTFEELPTANYFNFCLITSGGCLNNHQAVNQQGPTNIIIPANRLTEVATSLFISLPTINLQSNRLEIDNISVTLFNSIFSTQITIPLKSSTLTVSKKSQEDLVLVLPKVLSSGSYYFNENLDTFKVYNKPCEGEDRYRNSKMLDGVFLQYSHNCQTGSYVDLPFSSNNFYFWHINYNLLSGKFPKFLLKGKNTYKDLYLSLEQGYPNIPGFKKLQQVGLPFRVTPKKVITNVLKTATPQPTYTYVHPQNTKNEDDQLLFTILHQSENQAILSLTDFNVIELPASWETLSISPAAIQNSFTTSSTNAKKIIPSLWKISVEAGGNASGDYFMEFNQGYDKQWKLFRTNNPLLALVGVNKSKAQQVKVNGLTNGWIIPQEELDDNDTYYALYAPERLALIGWLISLVSISIILLIKR